MTPSSNRIVGLADGTILSLDVGEKRIGVASAELSVKFAYPLLTLQNPDTFIGDIIELCVEHSAVGLIVGLPRSLDGQDTAQTRFVREFVAILSGALAQRGVSTPLYWIDEALTSVKAESELKKRGKLYLKSDIDALAATYMLEDYLLQYPNHEPEEQSTYD